MDISEYAHNIELVRASMDKHGVSMQMLLADAIFREANDPANTKYATCCEPYRTAGDQLVDEALEFVP